MSLNHGYSISIVPHFFADKSRNYYIVTVTINHVKAFDHTHANVNMDIGELMRT
jgi:hypothetical protein